MAFGDGTVANRDVFAHASIPIPRTSCREGHTEAVCDRIFAGPGIDPSRLAFIRDFMSDHPEDDAHFLQEVLNFPREVTPGFAQLRRSYMSPAFDRHVPSPVDSVAIHWDSVRFGTGVTRPARLFTSWAMGTNPSASMARVL
jgi:hypothetical protein